MPRRSIVKILYIDSGLDEKQSSEYMEKTLGPSLPYHCTFTVLSNGFSGLEAVSFTAFDAIFMRRDMKYLEARQVLLILRGLHIACPFVYLVDSSSQDPPEFEGVFSLCVPYTVSGFVSVLSEALRWTSQRLAQQALTAASSAPPCTQSLMPAPPLHPHHDTSASEAAGADDSTSAEAAAMANASATTTTSTSADIDVNPPWKKVRGLAASGSTSSESLDALPLTGVAGAASMEEIVQGLGKVQCSLPVLETSHASSSEELSADGYGGRDSFGDVGLEEALDFFGSSG